MYTHEIEIDKSQATSEKCIFFVSLIMITLD